MKFCSNCGSKTKNFKFPYQCYSCKEVHYNNPAPAVNLLQPVLMGNGSIGIVTIRRDIKPNIGKLALPGGFIDEKETWIDAAVREMREEANIHVHPHSISLLKVESNQKKDVILIFGVAKPISLSSLPPFIVNSECSERVIITEKQEMAFPNHEIIISDFFDTFNS